FFQAEDGIRDFHVTGVQTCALPISAFGQIRKQPLPEILVQVHNAASHLPLLLIGGSDSDIDEALPQAQLAALPESLRAKLLIPRSEERRVGKEGRGRWWQCQ